MENFKVVKEDSFLIKVLLAVLILAEVVLITNNYAKDYLDYVAAITIIFVILIAYFTYKYLCLEQKKETVFDSVIGERNYGN